MNYYYYLFLGTICFSLLLFFILADIQGHLSISFLNFSAFVLSQNIFWFFNQKYIYFFLVQKIF